jgi:hyperosmotically inducible protein
MTGCITDIYKSAVDERSLGDQYDDQTITMSIRKKFTEDEKIKYFDISTYVYNGHVYLVGEYETADQKNQIRDRLFPAKEERRDLRDNSQP